MKDPAAWLWLVVALLCVAVALLVAAFAMVSLERRRMRDERDAALRAWTKGRGSNGR